MALAGLNVRVKYTLGIENDEILICVSNRSLTVILGELD